MTLKTVVFDDSGSEEEIKISPPKGSPTRTRVRKVRQKKPILILEDEKSDKIDDQSKPNEDINEVPAPKEEPKSEENVEEHQNEAEPVETVQNEQPSDPNRRLSQEEVHVLQKEINRLPGYVYTSTLVPYNFEKITKISWNGGMVHFQLKRGAEYLYHAKVKKSMRTIPIFKGTKAHLSSSSSDAKLVSTQNYDFNTLYSGEKELMEVSFMPGKIPKSPRTVSLSFKNPIPEVPSALNSKIPSISPCGVWVLNHNGRFAISSIKNCILLDEKQTEFLSLMRTSNSEAQLEANQNIPPLIVFGFAIASFLCTVK
ncbi:hypothetical protein TVAG_091950 [Trichomonas vaginalis G3]|uniref:Tubby C-terminal domain-containing protein n=1 Tax=Trichomonas vaginalis (strain ATCC PRA-98 / G3) TaxID=412133 RepID=A2FN60_TRIV3|nr:hypothetical protein TVAGG3_0585280 [Trichomonas vaginalis G3]EAX93660.1 hypothetical protein TVAG_091950 [Trichomonas vaginalis G3]KAI5522842.1 hypothetical protein TVAGG3_0585280 [Trichomonas vaginalis G3]|eukprot:XP_001306590.1 hypothetical protein [Trichomonas vaginalis G3]